MGPFSTIQARRLERGCDQTGLIRDGGQIRTIMAATQKFV